ncbi:MAG: 1-deoxy-D-xylulose 5-phosphate reductoisomerase [Phycisphaerales bacterium]|nr:1-deoxy-D-xylulose 5-phosphate reductoisomerase [Phycisphaerales bacterium]
MVRRVIILGSTGSIGTQTVEVIDHLNALHEQGRFPHRLEVVGLAARKNARELDRQAGRFPRAAVAVTSGPQHHEVEYGGRRARFVGLDAAEKLVRETPCELVVSAIVGSAGLAATLAAVELGRDVALANKEALVAAGAIIVPAAHRSGSKLLPIDSEHSGLWQCLNSVLPGASGAACDGEPRACAPPVECPSRVRRVILTASGGPFRTWTKEQIDRATPDQALKHPTWSMGAKVTVDSASLMNKALEIIEAHWLFGLPGERIEAVIHPQSIVHAMAEFEDGGVIAHLAAADMRIPIQHALAWPERSMGAWPRVDWTRAGRLDFEPPDLERFPALKLAYRVITPETRGTTAGAILNAANEEAVAAFLAGKIGFGTIAGLVEEAMESIPAAAARSLECITKAEAQSRATVLRRVGT